MSSVEDFLQDSLGEKEIGSVNLAIESDDRNAINSIIDSLYDKYQNEITSSRYNSTPQRSAVNRMYLALEDISKNYPVYKKMDKRLATHPDHLKKRISKSCPNEEVKKDHHFAYEIFDYILNQIEPADEAYTELQASRTPNFFRFMYDRIRYHEDKTSSKNLKKARRFVWSS